MREGNGEATRKGNKYQARPKARSIWCHLCCKQLRGSQEKRTEEGEGKWAGPALGGTQPTVAPGSSQKKTISIRPPANHTPTMGVQRPGNCFWGAHVPILHVIQAT